MRPTGRGAFGQFARLEEVSNGKDTTTGHWEIAGVESEKALPVYPNGFPDEVIAEFERRTGRKCFAISRIQERTLSGITAKKMKTGALIVYTCGQRVSGSGE